MAPPGEDGPNEHTSLLIKTAEARVSFEVRPSLANVETVFSFHNVTYDLEPSTNIVKRLCGGKPEPKRLLHNVFGIVRPGETLAIMGGSGAGKSTLLDVLANRKHEGHVGGSILVNGHPRNALFKRLSGYVTQDDTLIGTLTVEETLMYTAQLRLSSAMPNEIKRRRVREVIADLKLEKAVRTLIGTDDTRGLSGGERKRVSIGVELITSPSILFLDEPTTGLDAKTALSIVELISELAREGARTIIYSIHQPRSNIYKLFDKLLLLSEGRTVWFGDALNAVPFIERSTNTFCDAHTNPADYWVDVIQGGTEAAIHMNNLYLATPQAVATLKEIEDIETGRGGLSGPPDPAFYREYASDFFNQTTTLISREFRSNLRNPKLFWTQLFQATVFSCIMGSLWTSEHLDPANPLGYYMNQLNALFFCTLYLALMTFSSTPSLILFRRIFSHERQSGMYRASSFALAKFVVDTPLFAISGAVFSSILFGLVGFRSETYPFFLLTSVLVILCGCSTIQFISSIASSIEVAMVMSTFINGMSIAFSGFYVTYPNLPVWLRWVYHASYLHYGLAAQVTNQYGDVPQGQPIMSYIFGSDSAPLSKWTYLWVLVGLICLFRTLTYFVLRFKKPSHN